MWWIVAACFGIFVVIWAVARRNTFHAVLNEIRLDIDKPLNERGLRILHLSDLHVERLSVKAEDLVQRCRAYQIDLIALTGDFLDQVDSMDKFLSYLDHIVQLKPQYGIYAVFGNHDYVIEPFLPKLKNEMEKRGCHVLINEHRTVEVGNKRLNIIGIDDYYSGHSDVAKAYSNLPEDGVNLVLTHDPTVVLTMNAYPFDYLLSGHFHGGQILYPKAYHLYKMSELPKRQVIKGLHFHDKKAFYISEGLGQTGVNMRLRSRPEITVHTLESARHSS
ncbi:metallophosphoesterase [Novibacillus thermophilus]|jgi:predicted MPP superfamily phosphohydrolase|uniref:Metallophosphoesterase n=1 Tax=Novibacillus thermophilus TaxID=1471761 RepID=A0A1U9K5Y2_9BACL|nr:metallophosphoesterase [Novibacillus thermophilus]AQS55467.1 metallophosphoesterase [Novibacillus thermophilus]